MQSSSVFIPVFIEIVLTSCFISEKKLLAMSWYRMCSSWLELNFLSKWFSISLQTGTSAGKLWQFKFYNSIWWNISKYSLTVHRSVPLLWPCQLFHTSGQAKGSLSTAFLQYNHTRSRGTDCCLLYSNAFLITTSSRYSGWVGYI